MRKDKEKAFNLRKEGKSYGEISSLLGVSKGTLSFWFSKFDWSQSLSTAKHKLNYSPEKIALMHKVRRQMLDKSYKTAEIEAEEEFSRHCKEPLFIAGLMLYEGEGDHSPNNVQLRLANTNYRVILAFKSFLETYYPEYKSRMRISLLLYPDLNPEECIAWWRGSLNDQTIKMHSPVVIQGRHKTRRLQYGVASLIISSKFLKVKILKLIDLVFKDLNAAIV